MTIPMPAIQVPIAHIATDALDLLRVDSEKLNQMVAVANAICLDVKHGRGRNIEQLASLVSFMARDQADYVDSQIRRMQADLDLAEGVQ